MENKRLGKGPSNMDWNSGEKEEILSSRHLGLEDGGSKGVDSDIDSSCKFHSYLIDFCSREASHYSLIIL